MASNKNQHFVPRCYLRPFTSGSENRAINLFNIDRRRFIEGAPVKNQCSGDYFYGEDLSLEKALQTTEAAYAEYLREIIAPGYRLTDEHRDLLRHFWLLQHLRTEAASKRAVEMNEVIVGDSLPDFRLSIRQAVQMSMHTFVTEMHIVDDLKICLLKNHTEVPFVTSDDPAVLTSRWQLEDRRTKAWSFGLLSAGALLLLPLTTTTLCIGYDGDVYSIPHEGGWVNVTSENDVAALNEHL